MKYILLLTRIDGDSNGVGHVTTIAHELSEISAIKDILKYAKEFAGNRANLTGIKIEIMEVKAQEEECHN